MQPLPWELGEDEKCIHLIARTQRCIATIWGNDERHPKNLEWCTVEQRKNHAAYIEHACNAFPIMQDSMERLFSIPGMPPLALEEIKRLMEQCYFEGVPPYVR